MTPAIGSGIIDIKKELTLTYREFWKMIDFYHQVHKRDPKAIGRLAMIIILVLALLHSMIK